MNLRACTIGFGLTLMLIAGGASCRQVMPERYANYDGGRVHVDLPRETKNSDRDPYVDKETSVVITLPGNGNIYLGKDREPIAREDLTDKLKQLLQKRTKSDELVYLAAGATNEYGDVVSVLDKIRLQDASRVGLLANRLRSDGPSRFAVELPNPPDPNEDLSMVKPNPLMLVVSIAPDLKVRLNMQDFGSVNDLEPLGAKLHDIFQQRTEMRAYRPGVETRTDLPESDRIEKTIVIKATRSMRYGDVIKIIDTVKGAGAAPIVLQIDDLAP
jgi:biopolymer transport protein ExbD